MSGLFDSRSVAAVDAELLEAAVAGDVDPRRWRGEFRWLLGHPALAALPGATGRVEPLTLGALTGEHAARFPVVSGDAEWLQRRSMAVLARRLAPHLARGHHVGLDLSAVARTDTGAALRAEQMRLVAQGLESELPGALARYGVAPRRLTLSAGADHPGLGALLTLRHCATLGRPRILVRLPDRLLRSLGGGECADLPPWPGDAVRLWQQLTALAHADPGVQLVLEHTTRPACTLAWGEKSDAVMPLGRFEVRADTAWLGLCLRLEALVQPMSRGALAELRRLLRACLRLADNLVDQLDWVSPDLAQDALVNRRLALHVTGIGDLVDRQGLDPAAFPAVNGTQRALRVLRRLLIRESNALARERGPFPGLELRELEATLARSLGRERAARLLRQAGLRHRHLLVISPWSVFPAQSPRWPLTAYLHLLPAIGVADTIAMRGDRVAQGLPVTDFRRLLQMTWAIARNRP